MRAQGLAASAAACLAACLAAATMTTAPSLASGTPKPGAPCPQAGISVQQGGKTLVCKKRKGKLVWVIGTPTGGGGGGGGGGGTPTDLANQPVPANGVWKVPKGYPTDLPPFGWLGEPAWFASNWEVVTTTPVGRTCSNTTPLTNLVTDLSDVVSITPQGFMQPGTHTLPVPHMYYNVTPEESIDDSGAPTISKRVNVFAPADMVIRGVMIGGHVSSNGIPYDEYLLSASVCGTLWFFTAHLGSINPAISRALAKAPRKECSATPGNYSGTLCIYSYLSVPLKAGSLLGRSSGHSSGFDFGMTDAAAPVPGKLDPGAFSPRWSAARCHLDYYPPAMRSQLAGLLLGDNGCGQLVSDQAGTAAGVWLAVGQRQNSFREDLHVALARHWSDASLRVFSIGRLSNVPGLQSARYMFTPSTQGNDRDFSLVKPGEVVCYDNLTREYAVDPDAPATSIYISMTTGATEQLRIAGAEGECPANPTMPAQFQTFERRNTLG